MRETGDRRGGGGSSNSKSSGCLRRGGASKVEITARHINTAVAAMTSTVHSGTCSVSRRPGASSTVKPDRHVAVIAIARPSAAGKAGRRSPPLRSDRQVLLGITDPIDLHSGNDPAAGRRRHRPGRQLQRTLSPHVRRNGAASRPAQAAP